MDRYSSNGAYVYSVSTVSELRCGNNVIGLRDPTERLRELDSPYPRRRVRIIEAQAMKGLPFGNPSFADQTASRLIDDEDGEPLYLV